MSHKSSDLKIPIQQHTLENGLKIILSPDTTAPIVTVAVYYHVGMRLEPQGRTGFAHLFEHLMFQGSAQMEKMELVKRVQENGGTLNGSTRTDFTNYWEVLPKHTLELALWMEADRMRGPKITDAELDNQRDVVKNEIRVNVLNRPYGSFPWIDMPGLAWSNWHNSHNGYGDMVDLDAANLEDVNAFFKSYYSPSNAALVVVGDFDVDDAIRMSEKYFSDIPSVTPPEIPNMDEPEWTEERVFEKKDALATKPALAISYQIPQRNSPLYFAMGLLDQLLLQGDDSLLHQELVIKKGLTGHIGGGINFLGHMFNARTPLLWTSSLIYDETTNPDEILEAFDQVLENVLNEHISSIALERIILKTRSSFYDIFAGSSYPGFGRADLLASFAMIDGNAERVNEIDSLFRSVSLDDIYNAANEYLLPTKRAILKIVPELSNQTQETS